MLSWFATAITMAAVGILYFVCISNRPSVKNARDLMWLLIQGLAALALGAAVFLGLLAVAIQLNKFYSQFI